MEVKHPKEYPFPIPDLDKYVEIAGTHEARSISDFLAWLESKEYFIMEFNYLEDQYLHVGRQEEIMADYFEIDLDAAMDQREQVYQWVVEQANAGSS